MNPTIINDLKSIDWNTLISYCRSLDDLNGAQWRFLKGFIIEQALEESSANIKGGGLTYCGDVHKDYDWFKHNVSVELKSQLSESMYCVKDTTLRKSFSIKLNNSQGGNKKTSLPHSDVADLLIVIRNDGAFVITRATVMEYASSNGDGFMVNVPNEKIIEIFGKVTVTNKIENNFKKLVEGYIKDDIKKQLSSV